METRGREGAKDKRRRQGQGKERRARKKTKGMEELCEILRKI